VVRVPDRLADEHGVRPGGLLRRGSPVRYYIPAAPVTLASTLTAAVALRDEARRAEVLTAAACSTTGAALTAYLVATVIRRLLDDGPPIGAQERSRLLGRWYRVNRVRLLLTAVASVALERASRQPR